MFACAMLVRKLKFDMIYKGLFKYGIVCIGKSVVESSDFFCIIHEPFGGKGKSFSFVIRELTEE